MNHDCPRFQEIEYVYRPTGVSEDCVGKRYRCKDGLFPLHTVRGRMVSVDVVGNVRMTPPNVDIVKDSDGNVIDIIEEKRTVMSVEIPDKDNIFSKLCNDKCPLFLWMKSHDCITYNPESDENLKKYLTTKHVKAEQSSDGNLPKIMKWDLK